MVYEWGPAAPRLSLSVLSLGYTYISGDHEVHRTGSAVMPLPGRTQSSSYALCSSHLTPQFADPYPYSASLDASSDVCPGTRAAYASVPLGPEAATPHMALTHPHSTHSRHCPNGDTCRLAVLSLKVLPSSLT